MTHTEQAAGILNQFVQRSRETYSLPAVAMRVLDLTNHPKVDIRELKETIETDPALTAKLLRVVNSPVFGLRGEVADLNQAIALLGVRSLKMLVLGFSLPRGLCDEIESEMLKLYWRHALIKSVAARELAQKIWRIPTDEIFTAALLQDFSVLVLVKELGASYAEFWKGVYANGGDIAEAESHALGFYHTVLTAQILSNWGLPDSVTHVVGMPPDEVRLAALPVDKAAQPQILHIADLIARLLNGGPPDVLDRLLRTAKRFAKISYGQLQQIVETVQELEPALEEAVDVNGDQVSYPEILAAAHDRLADEDLDGPASSSLDVCDDWDFEVLLAEQETARVEAAQTQQPWMNGPEEMFLKAPDEPGLLGRLKSSAAAARLARQPLALVLVEFGDVEELVAIHGLGFIDFFMQELEQLIEHCVEDDCYGEPMTDHSIALIMPASDQFQAAKVAREICRGVERWPIEYPDAAALSLNVGAASLSQVPKNFPVDDLLDAAERCLYGARNASGNSVKSIELV
ncbi:MAG: HDOD domain-containing protein [Pirellulaceae bacterium]|jgi:HD-like signal output (HDOD) protein/GGDEF domain-containing protein|nr:HDOD domain-containing protein [Pirellulaceae bacterium]MDP7018687.1 HDOD domain-containing protein [Pirellulaceae bacterium]